jgi:hypothetical protein
LSKIKTIVIIAGSSLTGRALKVLEPYAGKLARTVLRGRKLPGAVIVADNSFQVEKF